jgi:hypothetical protein
MWTRLNILLVFALSALYGQSLGFWPFDFVAGLNIRQSPNSDGSDGGAKRVAIIGVFNYFIFV